MHRFMRIVLDTNVLVVSLSRKSRFFPILKDIRSGRIELLVTDEILFEYEEVIGRLMSVDVAQSILSGLDLLPNVIFIQRYFAWNLIQNDPDDNKFIDCAIAGNANFVVTNDAHFNVLANIPFPTVKVIRPDDFLLLLSENE
ncbi:MAG: putative toxin-antitoxin system toxin component, PIN family [Saprospiraceae bacterium]